MKGETPTRKRDLISSVLVAQTKEAKFASDAGEIGKGQLHVKCLHESGDEDQRHRRIDIGSLNKGKTGGDGATECHSTVDFLNRTGSENRPDSKESNVACEAIR
jgi:hypothetical protein